MHSENIIYIKVLARYTRICINFSEKNCCKNRCSCEKIVVCMEDCIFCSYVCSVQGTLFIFNCSYSPVHRDLHFLATMTPFHLSFALLSGSDASDHVIISGGEDCKLKIWDTQSGLSVPHCQGEIFSAFSGHQPLLLTVYLCVNL